MDTITGSVVAIIILAGAWMWLKKEFPFATKVTETIVKGTIETTAHVVQKGIDLHSDSRREVTCTNCKTVIRVYGRQQCRDCGFVEERSELAPCNHCGVRGTGYVNCPTCGLSVRPWWLQRKRN